MSPVLGSPPAPNRGCPACKKDFVEECPYCHEEVGCYSHEICEICGIIACSWCAHRDNYQHMCVVCYHRSMWLDQEPEAGPPNPCPICKSKRCSLDWGAA